MNTKRRGKTGNAQGVHGIGGGGGRNDGMKVKGLVVHVHVF